MFVLLSKICIYICIYIYIYIYIYIGSGSSAQNDIHPTGKNMSIDVQKIS